MLTDSIYKNLGKPVKDQRQRSSGLSTRTIEIIAGYEPDQLRKVYERYNIRYLMREIPAWEKLEKYDVAKTIKDIIGERKEASKRNKI
jgi:hypothetical protein